MFAVITEGDGDVSGIPCPDCGRRRLEFRYIVDIESRIGYVLFWCNACLRGISVSRVRAPEGMTTYEIGDVAATEGIPNFTRRE
jgi:hypothetical protein